MCLDNHCFSASVEMATKGLGTLLDAAKTLGAGWLDRFFTVILPLSKNGLLIAATLTFTHTLGEFGIVLMIGGNLPGETRVLSIALFDYVETLNYDKAHLLAAGLVGFSLLAMVLIQWLTKDRVARPAEDLR